MVAEVVPWPAVTIAPDGTIHVYDVAPLSADIAYTTPDCETQAVEGPLIVPGVAGGPPQPQKIFCHEPRINVSKQLVLVLNIIKLCAGFAMLLRCAVVKRGKSTPLLLKFTSNAADESGNEPVLLIEIPPV